MKYFGELKKSDLGNNVTYLHERMQSINWERRALDSEIEYSRALKSRPIEYPKFIRMFNAFVPWCGDFNRAVGVKLSDFQSFEEAEYQVKSIHKEKNLGRPNRYDIYSPALNEALWYKYLLQKGYRLETIIFFCSPTLKESLPSEFVFYVPSEKEYIEWFCCLVQSRGYYEEEWFQTVRPLQLNFAQVFKPYWLLMEGDLVGWVYCANLGEYACLFEVEISQEFRGQGLGKILLRAIRIEGGKMGARFILLQTGERLRSFYEKTGFRECSRNSIIWLRE